MFLIISLVICSLPVIFCSILFSKLVKDFTFKNVFFSIFFGLLTIIPITCLQYFLHRTIFFDELNLSHRFLSALLMNGIIEETLKMLFIYFIPCKKKSLKSFVLTAILFGLSLGCFETIIYYITGTIHIGLRLITSVIIHSLCSGLLGIFIWATSNDKRLFKPFFTAVVCHGLYNFFANFSGFFWWFSIFVILYTGIQCILQFQKLHEKIQEEKEKNLELQF